MKRLLLAGAGWLALLGLALWLGLSYGPALWGLLQDEEHLQSTLAAYGALGPLIFIGLQFLQVVLFVIPGEVVQIAAGFLYGTWLGLLYSLIGIGLGSTAAFYLARALGRPFVEFFLSEERVEKLDRLLRRGGGLTALFLLFLLPGIPKDALCYVAGLSALPFPLFLGLSLLGRLPALSVAFGSQLAAQRWEVVGAIAGGALLILLLAYLLRGRLARHGLADRRE